MNEGALVWITGLPASGKSTFARAAHERLRAAGVLCCTLDGDELRGALVPSPGYDDTARDRFYATLANLAALLVRQGVIVLVPATAHRRAYRERARAQVSRFVEVWVDVPPDEVRRRDTKGLYAAFEQGRTHSVPGADLAYEPPLKPDLTARGGKDDDALDHLLKRLRPDLP